MKIILISLAALLTGCSIMPFFVEEVEEAVQFEIDANQHEAALREKKTA